MQSIMDKFLGPDWRTTVSAVLGAAGTSLAACTTGRWQVVGQVCAAVGLALLGVHARDRRGKGGAQ